MTEPITSPFFANRVSVSGVRPAVGGQGKFDSISGTVNAVAVDDGESDLADAVTHKTIKMRTYFVRRKDWFDERPPQPGDVFESDTGDRFGCERVSELQLLGWNCACRQI